MVDNIVNWIKLYSKNANIKTLVIGISGGVDSALVSTLSAMTGLETIVISMPIHQKEDQLKKDEAILKAEEQKLERIKQNVFYINQYSKIQKGLQRIPPNTKTYFIT
jgi:NAD+ synthase